MDGRQRSSRIISLWGLVVLACAYIVLLDRLPTLTTVDLLDGSIGVLLGLFICSYPAANAIHMLFFQRESLRRMSSEWSGLYWLGLNVLVLLMGWLDIAIGAARLVVSAR